MSEGFSAARQACLERNVSLAVFLRVAIFASAISMPTVTKLSQENLVKQSEWLLLQFAFGVVLLLSDVPTGYFADRVSRKASLFVGGALLVVGAAFYSCSTDLLSMLVAECILGVGYAFCSGADNALLYDSLRELNREHEAHDILRKVSAIQPLAMALFALAGGLVGAYSVRLPFVVEAVVFAAFLVGAWLVTEPTRTKLSAKDGLGAALQNIGALRAGDVRYDVQILVSASVFAGLQVMLWYYQLLFDSAALPLWMNGWFFFAFHLIAAAAVASVGRLLRVTGGYPRVMVVPPLVLGATYLGVALLPGGWMLLALFPIHVVRGWNNFLLLVEVNSVVASEVRATMLSLVTFINRSFYMLLLLFCSWLSQSRGAKEVVLVLAVGQLVVGALFALWLRFRAREAGKAVVRKSLSLG